MKRIFVMMIALTMATVSCVAERMAETDELRFNATNSTMTRAAEVTTETLQVASQTEALHVVSYEVDGAYFGAFDLIYAAGAWSYGDVIYHPCAEAVHYSSYPWQEGTVAATSYNFNYVASGDEDLLAGVAHSFAVDGNATLTYNHILSQINFAIVAPNGTEVEIADVVVKGIRSSSTFTLLADNTGDWAVPTGSADYDYVDISTLTATHESGEKVSAPAGSGLMLMPQTFAAKVDGTVEFEYSIWQGNHGGSGHNLIKSDIATIPFCDFEVTTWEPGKKYCYVIRFDKQTGDIEGLTYSDVVVTPWPDEQDVELGAE